MANLIDIQPNNLSTVPNGNMTKSITLSDSGKPDVRGSSQVIGKDVSAKGLGGSPGVTGPTSAQPVDSAELESLMIKANSQLQGLQNYIKFERDESSQAMVVFIKDSETDKVIRQIPTQEFLAISKNIDDYLEMRQQLSEKTLPPIGMITNETV